MKKGLVRIFACVVLSFALTACSSSESPARSSCCRVCSAGKPCGDSCISKNKTCNKGRGCACSMAEGLEAFSCGDEPLEVQGVALW